LPGKNIEVRTKSSALAVSVVPPYASVAVTTFTNASLSDAAGSPRYETL
jgi:hypothetical protein